MPRSNSPLHDRMIFTFGVPRSGTWWLQRMLVAHPQVSEVPSETNLFSRGIEPLLECFHHGARGSRAVATTYVDRDRLLDAVRDFCDRVLEPYLEPGHRYLAERSAPHVDCVATISDVYPDARLLHIVRDGRDVARSLLARAWGPDTVAAAAEQWRSGILSAREAAPPDRYKEVRYEDLLADLEGGIGELYEWLGLPVLPGAQAAALWEGKTARNEDPGDARLASGKWRDSFDDRQLSAFLGVAGDLLAELGYDVDEEAAPPSAPAPAPSARVRSALGRLRPRRPQRETPEELPGGQSRLQEIGGVLLLTQRVVDTLLEAIQVGKPEHLSDHLAAGIQTLVVTNGKEERLLGPSELIEWLRANPVVGATQLRADPHPGTPNYSVVLRYRQPDGSEESRVLQFIIHGSQLHELTVYRFFETK